MNFAKMMIASTKHFPDFANSDLLSSEPQKIFFITSYWLPESVGPVDILAFCISFGDILRKMAI